MSDAMTLPRHPFLDLIPDGSPEEQLRSLRGLGLLPQDLLAAARSLFADEADALMAMPLSLAEVLEHVTTEGSEKALLGFTIRDFLTSSILAKDARTASWEAFPHTLRALIQDEHPYLLQVIYLGTICTFPDDYKAWERASRVMKAVDHPRALPAIAAPPIGPVDRIYNSAPGLPSKHPFLFFSKKGF